MKQGFISRLAAVVILAVGGIAGIETTQDEWTLATDVQKYYRCLPFDWYLVHTATEEYEPIVGDLVRFKAPDYVKRFTDQFEIIKYVAAVAGDAWEVRGDILYVNGREWSGLPLLTTLNKRPGSLDRAGVVPDGHVFVLGTNPSSYDSRYWGPLNLSQVTGRAYVLL